MQKRVRRNITIPAYLNKASNKAGVNVSDIDTLFKNRKIKFERLRHFGFLKNEDIYTYSTDLLNGQFEMRVAVTKKGKVSAEVIDISSKEHYVLHLIVNAKGAFVGTVRDEYENVLVMIADACFEPDVFKSEDAKKIIQYVRKTYQDELEFLWKRSPSNAIFRRKDNAKWYAALLTVQKKKLGFDEDGSIEIIDLRGKPENIEALLDGEKYLSGYHMNKKHWFTICLNGSVSLKEICNRINDSFELAAK